MDRTDDVGAAAAAEYFMRLFPYVMTTGDLASWDRISDPECEFCAKVREDVETVYSAGGRITGGALTLEEAEVLGQHPTLGGWGIGVPFTISDAAEVDASGAVLRGRTAETGYAVVDAAYTTQGWILVGVSLRSAEAS